MRPADIAEANALESALAEIARDVVPLPGVATAASRSTLVRQIIDSENRNRFIGLLRSKGDLTERSADPTSGNFDVLRAAILRERTGDFDEACWLVFLYVHFGKHRTGGWQYATDVYGRLGGPGRWDWNAIRDDVDGFRDWLDAHIDELRDPARPHGFGNHRKYVSLDARSSNGTGAAVASYVEWVGSTGTHHTRVDSAVSDAAGDPALSFDNLYRSLGAVQQFGRVAQFDYVTMLGKLGLAPVRAGKAYLVGATGPRRGVCLLFGKSMRTSARELDDMLQLVEDRLDVGFDVLEDALCNWQKSPTTYQLFQG